MADPVPPSAVAQDGMPQRCLVNVKPVGCLANPDLPSFKVSLSSSHAVTKSASRLSKAVKQRLNLESQPVFYVSIGGEQCVYLVEDMLADFMEEMGSKQESAFEESDASAGLLTTFCDLPGAGRQTAEAARQAAAAGQAAVDGSQPAPTQKKPKREPKPNLYLCSAATKAINKWWPRTRPDGKRHLKSSCSAACLQFDSPVWFKRCSFCLHQCLQGLGTLFCNLLGSPQVRCDFCVQVRAKRGFCGSKKPPGPGNGWNLRSLPGSPQSPPRMLLSSTVRMFRRRYCDMRASKYTCLPAFMQSSSCL